MDNVKFWRREKEHRRLEEQTKRITTPAGQRLSTILEAGDLNLQKAQRAAASRAEADSNSNSYNGEGSGYSYDVWADGEKHGLRRNKQIAKRGGWKRLFIIFACVLLLIIGLVVGLVVGLRKRDSSSASNSAQSSSDQNQTPTSSLLPPLPSTSLTPTSLPSTFPLGEYTYTTFLDTVQTNCTSAPQTWTCFPYETFNSSPETSRATFTWRISGKTGALKISSTDNPFAIMFKDVDLKLQDEGKDSERYHFQLSQTRTTTPSEKVGESNAAVECEFEGTSIQASLYTRMERTYPEENTGLPKNEWPFAVRVEQSVGGGANVPSCTTVSDERAAVTEGIEEQDAGQLCSCLYKNWRSEL